MIAWGINALNHGNSLAVISDTGLEFFKSGTEDTLFSNTIVEALAFGAPDQIYWYERPWLKKTRQLFAGQYRTAGDLSVLPSRWLRDNGLGYAPVKYTPHHGSHAAAGYYTSPFDHAAIVVLDAIGEWECATIWEGIDGRLTKQWSRSYPHSLGLFYSAFTKLIGLTPIKDEHLLGKMALQGDATRYYDVVHSYFDAFPELTLNYNFHRGVEHWDHPINCLQDQCDIAAAVQRVFEQQVVEVMTVARHLTGAKNLVYMGGCAMNNQANRLIEPMWEGIWSLPNPGDPSSAIGAVLYHTQQRIQYPGALAKHIAIKL
jgi:carbamoyltransferase